MKVHLHELRIGIPTMSSAFFEGANLLDSIPPPVLRLRYSLGVYYIQWMAFVMTMTNTIYDRDFSYHSTLTVER
jgi:hypothetical protein